MAPHRDPHEIDPLLRDLHVSKAPEALWDRVQHDLETPEALPQSGLMTRPIASRMLAAAAIMLAMIGGAVLGTLRNYRAPARWDVLAVAGTPTIAGTSLTEARTLGTGEWLVTDSVSVAQLDVGRIGSAQVGPNSRVRLDRGGRTQHRLTLERGTIDAVIDAPPRLFFVETPTTLATDLGCVYTLEVDSAGVTWIHVTGGWVELKKGDRASLVSAGMAAEVNLDGVPGTPYPYGMAEAAREALKRLDEGSNDPTDLETVVAAMYPQSMFVTARQPTTITLWHLLQRLDGPLRVRAFETLTDISEPPSKVTREGILALDRPMLERWRRDLNPMWSEEDVPLVVRAARRLWEWAVN